jgi:hypothetical protein
MTEGMPPEGGQQQPLTRAQIFELKRSMREQILNRAESDPEWRQLFIDDPELAMREANFPAAQQLQQQPQGEVVGQMENWEKYGWSIFGSGYTPPRGRWQRKWDGSMIWAEYSSYYPPLR